MLATFGSLELHTQQLSEAISNEEWMRNEPGVMELMSQEWRSQLHMSTVSYLIEDSVSVVVCQSIEFLIADSIAVTYPGVSWSAYEYCTLEWTLLVEANREGNIE